MKDYRKRIKYMIIALLIVLGVSIGLLLTLINLLWK